MIEEHVEREDKYDVGADFSLPNLAVDSVEHVESATHLLQATYFDTPDGSLRRRGITLRKRRGGHDAGWHLKLPAESGRLEMTVQSTAASVPAELSALLLGVRRGQKLSAAATISTTRDSHVLRDADGRSLAEVADDTVHAVAPGADAAIDWREIEVELSEYGDEELLRRVGRRLREAGAEPSPSASKSSRAIGPVPSRARPTGLAGLVDVYLKAQYDAILEGDVALRRGLNAIHRTRVAVRRLRSTVRTFDSLFDSAAAGRLETELVWYAATLGAVRDLDVLRERLTDRLSGLPDEFIVGPVSARIESSLAAERATAYQRLRRAMNGRRYLALLALLEQWRLDPPYTDVAREPEKSAARHVARAEKKMLRRLRRATRPGADDDLLHKARKAEKRYRYACELAQSVLGKQTDQAIKNAKALQKLLGEFQDSVVSAAMLRRLGMQAGSTPGENGFTYGVLLAQEWEVERATRALVVDEYR